MKETPRPRKYKYREHKYAEGDVWGLCDRCRAPRIDHLSDAELQAVAEDIQKHGIFPDLDEGGRDD